MGTLYFAGAEYDYSPESGQDFKTSEGAFFALKNHKFVVSFGKAQSIGIVKNEDDSFTGILYRNEYDFKERKFTNAAVLHQWIDDALPLLNWHQSTKKYVDSFINLQLTAEPKTDFDRGWLMAIQTIAPMLGIKEGE